ncbi:hypothetical protein MMC26_007209 [Xylographa opegraphella]|nr:hypothetical protein [Xylographa opegraphella]
MESPYKKALDSPSRQLLWELGRLHVGDREAFHAKLEKESSERESAHREALAAAAKEHELIRRSAEREREKLELQIKAEKSRREEEERRELHKEQQRQREEKLEKELAQRRREIERVQAEEAAVRKAAKLEEARAAEAEQRRLEREKEDLEIAEKAAQKKAADQKLKEHESKAKAAAAASLQARLKPQATTAPAPVPQALTAPVAHRVTPITQNDSVRQAEHDRYLHIHKSLKEFRKFMSDQGKQNPTLKTQMGDMRRIIKKCVGQLTSGKESNRQPRNQVMEVLKTAAKITQPEVDVSMFLANPPSGISMTKGPALLIYLLNIFAKALIAQFINEASIVSTAADPIGVVGSQIFASSEFHWNSLSLVDILIAKYHFVCPILFGIYGNEETNQGRFRSGWIEENKGSGHWISEQKHFERMTGLGSGYAAISLRNYDKSRLQNPYPVHNFWRALAAIINTPPKEASSTHFTVLKALVENNETRILEFFGNAGRLALKKALIDFPRESGSKSVSAKSVAMLPDIWRKDKKLFL